MSAGADELSIEEEDCWSWFVLSLEVSTTDRAQPVIEIGRQIGNRFMGVSCGVID